ncbi:MAG: hypothetical protein PF689_05230 [Deltaproteobacteria bacterium]|jgi:hypothetical protein|nr:hypothetical protein [Deltaproteobacteria bacterium]
MKTKKTLLLWFTFFLTTTITFGLILIPSYLYWMKNPSFSRAFLAGTIGSVLFGLVYSVYKVKTLYYIKIELPFTIETEAFKEHLENELIRLGYRHGDQNHLFVAGFRSDYYMAPDIIVELDSDSKAAKVKGPCFYLKKLKRRHNRWLKKNQ